MRTGRKGIHTRIFSAERIFSAFFPTVSPFPGSVSLNPATSEASPTPRYEFELGERVPPVQTSVLLQDRYLVPSSTRDGYCMSARPDSAQKWQLFNNGVKKMSQITVAIDLKMRAFPCIQQGDCSFFFFSFGTKRAHVHYNDVLYIQTSAACHA